jgi:hypothetical protein
VLALDPGTGKIKTHFHYHQNDSWDWDEVDAPILVNLERRRRPFKGLIHPGRNAIMWILEAKPDRINYVAGWPYVYTDVWKGIDQEAGKPIVDLAHKPVMGKRVEFCPSLWGGKDWLSAAWSLKTKLVYVPANENFCGGFNGEKVPLVPGQLWLGTKPEDIGLTVRPGATHFGELQAWDPSTGKKVWSHNFPKSHLFGSVTATAGDLILVGGTNDRMFRIFDAKTGKVLWEQKTNSGIMGMPVAYEVDGTQYIAVQSGWGVDAQRIQDALATSKTAGIENNVPQGWRGSGCSPSNSGAAKPRGENRRAERSAASVYARSASRFTCRRAQGRGLFALGLDLRFFVLVHLLHRRIAAGFAGGLGSRGRRRVAGHGALLGRIVCRPCGGGRRRVRLRARRLCVQKKGARQ